MPQTKLLCRGKLYLLLLFCSITTGSSAGAGSADFHIYRNNRKRELARLEFIDKQAHKEDLNKEFQDRLDEHKREAEEKTAKKRAKRYCTYVMW